MPGLAGMVVVGERRRHRGASVAELPRRRRRAPRYPGTALPYVAGLSLSAFRFSTSSGLIGAFRLIPFGGIGDMNHLL